MHPPIENMCKLKLVPVFKIAILKSSCLYGLETYCTCKKCHFLNFYNISKKVVEIPIFGTFSAKFCDFGQSFTMFTENQLFWGSACFITSLRHYKLDVRTYFGIYGKRRTIAILWYQLDVCWGFRFQVQRGNVNPLGKPCYRKRLCKATVKVAHRSTRASGCLLLFFGCLWQMNKS